MARDLLLAVAAEAGLRLGALLAEHDPGAGVAVTIPRHVADAMAADGAAVAAAVAVLGPSRRARRHGAAEWIAAHRARGRRTR